MQMIVRLAALILLSFAVPAALAQSKIPSDRALEALVKISLLTFNDANVTGIYTVLHAKLSKPFRDQFPPEKLKQTFQPFAEKGGDIDIIAAVKPTYDPAPKIDDDGQLIVSGYFPLQPVRVLFDLEFIPSDGEWKLIRLHVQTKDAP
jgi:hypothetical protein